MKSIEIQRMIKTAGLLYIVVLCFASCNNKNQYQSPPLSVIEVSEPKEGEVTRYFEYPGYTQSQNTVELVARVSGFLEKVNYRPGTAVKKGDLLFVIEPQTYKDKVDEAQASLSNAEASLNLAQESLDRVNEAARSNAVSKMDVIKAQTMVDQAQAAVKSAKSQLDQAKKSLEYCYVKAPFSGRISKNTIDEGNYVNNAQILATIFEDDDIYINFNVEDSKYMIIIEHLQNAGKNQKIPKIPVEIMLEGSDKIFKGIINYVSPNVDVSTGTFSMRAIVENKKWDLSSGMYVRVRVPYAEVSDALLVPATAIGSDQSGDYMYVLNDSNIVQYRSIKPGVTTKENYREIREGLEPKELFVTKALLKVRDGMPVNPNKTDFTKAQ